MAFTNSKLVNHTRLCNDYSKGRVHKTHNPKGVIDKITIHHMAGNLSVEKCGELFATSPRDVSSNYGVGTDGRIGLYVEEKNRPWTSSSAANDYRAVTIEVANDKIGGDWHVSDKALEATIKLCVDICQRNGIKKLNYTGDKSGNLTMHKFFNSTACPGTYLESKFPYIAQEVNKRLNAKTTTTTQTNSSANKNTSIKEGNKVKMKNNAPVYGTNKTFDSWVYKSTLYVREIKGSRAVISTQKTGAVTGAVDIKYLTKV